MEIRALLVDDEPFALRWLQSKLCEVADWEQLAMCTDADEALRVAETMQPDVIFLDISMPEKNGLEMAKDLEELCPSTSIVFVTAYDEYAVAAFEANAIDYLLKPVENKRLNKTVQKLRNGSGLRRASNQEAPRSITVHCFPLLRYSGPEGGPFPFKWRTTKAEELFAYLVHYRGRTISRDKLTEALWPDIDPQKAAVQLYTAVYQMRQGLKKAGLPITVENVRLEEGYRIPADQLRLESEEWERGLLELRDRLDQENNLERLKKLVDQYEGDYLGEYDYPWAEEENERLRSMWTLYALHLTELLIARQRYREAAMTGAKVLRSQPYCDEAHLLLLQAYDGIGDLSSVLRHYQEAEKIFRQELGIGMQGKLVEWYKSWLSLRSERAFLSS